MVYHFPGDEPLRNSWWLGPLRLLTSDQQSCKMVRALPTKFITYEIAIAGIVAIIENFDWSHRTVEWYNEYINLPIRTFVVLLGILVIFVEFLSFVWRKWQANICARDGWAPYTFFHWSEDKPEPTANPSYDRPGVVFVKKLQRWFVQPVLTMDAGLVRSFNTRGMKFVSFLFMEATVGVEYGMTAIFRIIGYYLNFPGYGRKHNRTKLYYSVLNTSLACFIDYQEFKKDGKKNPHYGDCVIPNVRLPYADQSTRTYDKIIMVLDHEKVECTKVISYHTRETDGFTEVQVWGSPDHEENAFANKISNKESVRQAGLIIALIDACFCHGTVHWWANGVAALGDPKSADPWNAPAEVWQTAPESNNITQWMNTQAVFGSPFFFGNTYQADAKFLVYNSANGLPLHGNATDKESKTYPPGTPLKEMKPVDLMIEIGKRSTFHQMSRTVQAAVQDILTKDKRDANKHIVPQVQSIVAATIMHNIEHYLLGENAPIYGDGCCILIQSDFSGFFMSLVYPINWKLRAMRINQYLNDPICAAMYKVAAAKSDEIKQQIAADKKAGKTPVFADPGNFVETYFTIGCTV